LTVKTLQTKCSQLQILAPSGSEEQLIAAVNNGCDAVYLGLDSFNARMKAPNFTAESLDKWTDYCHLFGVKVYVAINTSIKNGEFDDAVKLLKKAYLANADGVIVTDLTLMQIAGSLPKPFEVVASTQLNVHDRYGAEFVKKCGATTVVCARECSVSQIREIASVGINVECFLHGAMCVCQSGQCLMSSMIGGNSGNRGLCAQPCRKYYYCENSYMQGYLLSAHDICSLETMKDLVKAGVSVFKIEGRNRRPEYAAMASRVYRKLFDNNFDTDKNDYSLLAEMFNRGMSENNYLSGANSDIIYSAVQNHSGVTVGKVERGKVASVCALRKGDGLKVFDGNKEVCGGTVLEDGTFVRAQFSDKVSDGMTVNRTTSAELCEQVLSAKRKRDVTLEFIAKVGYEPIIIAKCGEISAEIKGDFAVQQALNNPTTCAEIEKQLRKTGDTYYTITNIILKIDNIFIAKSQLNLLRRQVLELMTQKIVGVYNSRFSSRKNADLSEIELPERIVNQSYNEIEQNSVQPEHAVCAVCYNQEELFNASKKADCLIYKPDNVDAQVFSVAEKYGAYVDLPSFSDLQYVENLLKNQCVGIVCNNVGQVEFARQKNIKYVAGGGLNLFNDRMINTFNDARYFVYSRELSLNEISSFCNKNGLTFVDGRLPLMQLCHCPYKVAVKSNCSDCKAKTELVYKDELGNKFNIKRRYAGRCVFELFNGNKLSVVNKLKTGGRYIIDYDENVMEHYVRLNKGIVDGFSESKQYTKGRLYSKVN